MLKSKPAEKNRETIMLKAVIDTNVAVSALLSPSGNPAQIIDCIFEEELKPCFCSKILAEYTNVLARPRFGFSAEDQAHVIEGIKKYGEQIEPPPYDTHFTHEADQVFYEVAKSAGAYLVTGNTKHFPDEPFVINPAKCVELLSAIKENAAVQKGRSSSSNSESS